MNYRWLYTGVAIFALLLTGLVHGAWTDRWVHGGDTQAAADLLTTIPTEIGDWKGIDLEVKPGAAGAGVTGCIQRTYTNANRRATVVMALVNGRPAHVAIHTPEACYGANGYTVGERKLVRLDNQAYPAHFWCADAVKTTQTTESRLRIYWAWSAGEGWVAASDARTQFSPFRHPILQKLYVLRDLNGPDSGKDEACEAFLQELLPQLDQTLFGHGS